MPRGVYARQPRTPVPGSASWPAELTAEKLMELWASAENSIDIAGRYHVRVEQLYAAWGKLKSVGRIPNKRRRRHVTAEDRQKARENGRRYAKEHQRRMRELRGEPFVEDDASDYSASGAPIFGGSGCPRIDDEDLLLIRLRIYHGEAGRPDIAKELL